MRNRGQYLTAFFSSHGFFGFLFFCIQDLSLSWRGVLNSSCRCAGVVLFHATGLGIAGSMFFSALGRRIQHDKLGKRVGWVAFFFFHLRDVVFL